MKAGSNTHSNIRLFLKKKNNVLTYMVTSFLSEPRKCTIILILFSCIFFLRIVNLDQDLPPFGIGYHQPVDEGAYSLLALNLQNYGTLNPESPVDTGMQFGSFTSYHLRVDLLGNILIYLGLILCGDNYYGLRLSCVIIGYINFLLFFKILYQINRKTKMDNYVGMLVCMIYLLFDFMFYMSTKAVEPSALRLTFVELLVLTNMKYDEKLEWKAFLSGLLITISVFLIYITNTFLYIVLPVSVFYYIGMKKWKQCLSYIFWFMAGCGIALALSEIYYYKVWNIGAVRNAFEIFKSFQNQVAYAPTSASESAFSGLVAVARKFLAFFEANCFTFNILGLFLFLFGQPIFIFRFKKRKEYSLLIIYSLIVGLLLQTLVIEDYIGRKCIMVYPIILAFCFFIFSDLKCLEEWRRDKLNSTGKKCGIIIWSGSCIVICMMLLLHKLYAASVQNNLDYGSRFKAFILGFSVCALCLAVLYITFYIIAGKKEWKGMIHLAVLSILLLNMGLIVKYQVLSPTFYERDSMKALADYVDQDGTYVIGGGFELGFTLYNNMQYILVSRTKDAIDALKQDEQLLYIDYSVEEPYTKDMQTYYRALINDDAYQFEPIYVLKRNFQTFDTIRSFTLYRLVKYE